MSTLTCPSKAPNMPLNNRDAQALDDIFEGFDGDPIGEIDALLTKCFGSRRRPNAYKGSKG